MEKKETERLRQLLQAGTSAALTVQEAARQLAEAGFEELHFSQSWGLNQGGKYYMKHHDTTLFAFTVGEGLNYREGFRIGAAHTDYPCLRIKPCPDIETAGYGQLNVEVYGGPILNTWLDRPLGVSGRVALASGDPFRPRLRLVDIRQPVAVIPNLAIHLRRGDDKGAELNKQTELLPVFSTGEQQEGFLDFLARELGEQREEILDYELSLCCLEEPRLVGARQELLVSPRLDNLTSVQSLLSGLMAGSRQQGVNLIALFDHEEVGSQGKQGAGSMMLLNLMEKIYQCFGRTECQIKEAIYDSMMLSVDVAQGTHPNYLGKIDPTNRPVLNGGLCIKEACSQSYATDCRVVAIVEQLCRAHDISYQKYVNRSDIRGGSTLGVIASGSVPIPTVDIGVPLLAMHSAVETMGWKDQQEMTRLVTAFFQH